MKGGSLATSARRATCMGFTLLEVLAAVAILLLAFTTLAGVAGESLLREGESGRELRASLLADQELAQLEASLYLETAPPVGREEREEEEFLVEVETAALDLELPAPSALAKRASQADSPPASLLHRGRGTATSPLRQIDVRVSWTEGLTEHEVRRTSFALDPETAAPILEALAASQAAREQAQDETPPQEETPPVREEDQGAAEDEE